MYKSKRNQFLTDVDDFGVVEKPCVSAFQRHQNHRKPLKFAPVPAPFLIFVMSGSAAIDTLVLRNIKKVPPNLEKSLTESVENHM